MLDSELLASIQQLVEKNIGRSIQLGPTRTVSGGCINHAIILETDIGLSLFVKWNEQAPGSLFECETDGLEAIRLTQSLRVPEVIGSGVSAHGVQFLVLEAIQTAAPGAILSNSWAGSWRNCTAMESLKNSGLPVPILSEHAPTQSMEFQLD